jgi:hypothetical protein
MAGSGKRVLENDADCGLVVDAENGRGHIPLRNSGCRRTDALPTCTL